MSNLVTIRANSTLCYLLLGEVEQDWMSSFCPYAILYVSLGFPSGSDGKEFDCSAEDPG